MHWILRACNATDSIRERWAIENQCHWPRDTKLGEDAHRSSQGNGGQASALLRTLALNLLGCYGFRSVRAGLMAVVRHISRMLGWVGISAAWAAYDNFQSALILGVSRHWLGVCRLGSDDAAGTVEALAPLVDRQPQRHGSLLQLGLALLRSGNHPDASASFLSRLMPGFVPESALAGCGLQSGTSAALRQPDRRAA